MADSAAISQLSTPDSTLRAAAATELYRQGCALSDAVVNAWRALGDFAALLTGSPTVGIAVQLDTFNRIRAANGSPQLADVPPNQNAKEFELHFDHGVALDILSIKMPGGGGAIASFLEKFGEDIQQVEYQVTDVDRATQILRTQFHQQPIYPQTRAGADGTRVNFFLARIPEGKKVLIELVEIPRPKEAS